MSSIIEEIKSRLNITDVVGSYLKLDKAGSNHKARCPFHNEQTPSFFVSPARQSYHCFGCNRGGDIFSFVEEIEGLDFSGALKVLAERAGVELTHTRGGVSKEIKDEREMLYRTLDLATKFYEAVLPKFPEAVEYLKKRGLTDETIKHFRVGFAPDEWRALGDFLTKKGVSEETMERAGLIVRSEKGFYDRFRSRVMFPMRDSGGRVVAFSGRILKEGDGKTLGASAAAKYVNSPETEVFHKSRILFGFYEAKDAIRKGDSAVLVEGQMDLVLSHQAGVTNAVASSGTALTAEHLTLIKRFTKNLVLALDQDDAGRAANLRAINLALIQDMDVHIVVLPLDCDPGDMALESPQKWKESVNNRMQVIDYYLWLLPTIHPDKAVLRSKVSEIIVPFIAELRSAIDQGHYVGQVAKLLGIKDDPVWDEVKKHGHLPPHGAENRFTLGFASATPSPRRARIVRTIEGILLWQEGMKESAIIDILAHRKRLASILLLNEDEGEIAPTNLSELIFEAETRFQESKDLSLELEELYKILEDEILRVCFAEKMGKLKEAEVRGDAENAAIILAECQELSKKLHMKKS